MSNTWYLVQVYYILYLVVLYTNTRTLLSALKKVCQATSESPGFLFNLVTIDPISKQVVWKKVACVELVLVRESQALITSNRAVNITYTS